MNKRLLALVLVPLFAGCTTDNYVPNPDGNDDRGATKFPTHFVHPSGHQGGERHEGGHRGGGHGRH